MEEQKRKNLDWFIVLGASIFNILFFFIPLADETAFMSLWNITPWLAIPVGLVPLGFLIGRLIMSIKKW